MNRALVALLLAGCAWDPSADVKGKSCALQSSDCGNGYTCAPADGGGICEPTATSAAAAGTSGAGTAGSTTTSGTAGTSTGASSSSSSSGSSSSGTASGTSGSTTGTSTGGTPDAGCGCTLPGGSALVCDATACASGQRFFCAPDGGGGGTAVQCGSCADGGFAVGACGYILSPIAQVPPVLDVTAFGAVGDGQTDDTVAIQSALDSEDLSDGGTLVFPPGTYLYGGTDDAGDNVLHVRQPNIALWGYGGAELHSDNMNSQEISLESPGDSVYGFLITAPYYLWRGDQLFNQRIVLSSSGNNVVDNHIAGGASGGIFAYGASQFLIARNLIENTLAESIYITPNGPPSQDGFVLQNTATAPGPYWGDDLIGVFSFIGDADAGTPDQQITQANQNLLIACNLLENAGWGSGVDIEGGLHITIEDNVISQIHHAAGVKLGSEAELTVSSTLDVTVADNQIYDTETSGPTEDGTFTGYGAIELASRETGASIQQVILTGNLIDRTIYSGIRFQGPFCDMGFEDNALDDLDGSEAFDTDSFSGLISVGTGCLIGCGGNTLDGGPVTSTLCNSTSMPNDVAGASLQAPPSLARGCGFGGQ